MTRPRTPPPPPRFRTNDLMEHHLASRNHYHILNCMMDLARGAPYLAALPKLVQFERQITMHDSSTSDSPTAVESSSDADADADAAQMEAWLSTAIAGISEQNRRSIHNDEVTAARSRERSRSASPEKPRSPSPPAARVPSVEAAGKGQYWIEGQKMSGLTLI